MILSKKFKSQVQFRLSLTKGIRQENLVVELETLSYSRKFSFEIREIIIIVH